VGGRDRKSGSGDTATSDQGSSWAGDGSGGYPQLRTMVPALHQEQFDAMAEQVVQGITRMMETLVGAAQGFRQIGEGTDGVRVRHTPPSAFEEADRIAAEGDRAAGSEVTIFDQEMAAVMSSPSAGRLTPIVGLGVSESEGLPMDRVTPASEASGENAEGRLGSGSGEAEWSVVRGRRLRLGGNDVDGHLAGVTKRTRRISGRAIGHP
jgi:hypothetical protein